MTRSQQRREQLVGKYHRNMTIGTLAIALGTVFGAMLMWAFAEDIDRLAGKVLLWMFGLSPLIASIILAIYFLAVLTWAHFKFRDRHDHP